MKNLLRQNYAQHLNTVLILNALNFALHLMKLSFSAKLMAENREMISDLENCSQVAAQHLSKFANIIWLEEE